MHKLTKITPIMREEIYYKYLNDNTSITQLASMYHVSRPTIYKIIDRGIHNDFTIHTSKNKRYNKIAKSEIKENIEALFKVLHSPPSRYNINRTTWRLNDLQSILFDQGYTLTIQDIRKIIKNAGYTYKKAKKVLTSLNNS